MYIETIKPVSLLSLSLQTDGVDFVLSMVNTMKYIKSLKGLTEQNAVEWPMVQLVKSRQKVVDGSPDPEYQGVAIPEFDTALQVCSRHVVEDLRHLDQGVLCRGNPR